MFIKHKSLLLIVLEVEKSRSVVASGPGILCYITMPRASTWPKKKTDPISHQELVIEVMACLHSQ